MGNTNSINGNEIHLSYNSVAHRNMAKEALMVAKQQEEKKLAAGYQYVTVDGKTRVLRK